MSRRGVVRRSGAEVSVVLDLNDLPGSRILGVAHPLRDGAGGFDYVDVLTPTIVYRFKTEEIDGERTDGGWTMDHYSLCVGRLETHDQEAPSAVPRFVSEVVQVPCDEWLGPVDLSLPAYGVDPRDLMDGPVGSAPAGTPRVTVTRGVIVKTDGPSLLISTHSFPQLVDYTTDLESIQEFLSRYSPTKALFGSKRDA